MADTPYDVVIVGAGMSGIYSLYRMRELGLRVKVLEAGSDVGGTWYWNRYPGARFDSESYSYGYSFSPELLHEWNWTEHFAGQPEIHQYINFVVDKMDLRRDIVFNSRVKAAHYHEPLRSWKLELENGDRLDARFFITAIGPLSQPTLPNIPGVHDFQGESFHTARWPHHHVSFDGKRVGIIGTGATGVQTIQEVAKTAGHLTVFQRTPNWCVPLHNSTILPSEMDHIKRDYPDIFDRCSRTFSCFIHTTEPRGTFDVPPAEREAFWEKLYASPGLGLWVGNFRDIPTDPKANDLVSAFVERKIRQRVKDAHTANKLIPHHGFGTRRVPLETNYYEVYNRANVTLVDIRENPIERVTEDAIKTATDEYQLDMIIYATGFDAVTGAFDAMDIRGLSGQRLKDKWTHGPRTYLGLAVVGFPNMFMIMGPHQVFGNIPRSIEYAVDWVAGLQRYARDHGLTYVEATEDGERSWTDYVYECSRGLLANEVDSWMTGVNTNVKDKGTRIVARYSGSAPNYRKRCEEVAKSEYREMRLL